LNPTPLSDNLITIKSLPFNVDDAKKGIGLANIKRRVESLSGKLRIESSPGKGCVIEVLIPVKEEIQNEDYVALAKQYHNLIYFRQLPKISSFILQRAFKHKKYDIFLKMLET